MQPPPLHCLAPEPRTETLPAGAAAESGVKQPPPTASIPLIRSQRAGKRFQRREELTPGKDSSAATPGGPGCAGCPPGGTSRQNAASFERASQPRSHKSPLSAPPELLEGSSHRGTAGDPHGAREKCRAGTEQLFQPGLSSGKLAGTGGCFPAAHVRSKQRKKEKNSLRVLEQQLPSGPFTPAQPAPCEKLARSPHTKITGGESQERPKHSGFLVAKRSPGQASRVPGRGEFSRSGRRAKRAGLTVGSEQGERSQEQPGPVGRCPHGGGVAGERWPLRSHRTL